MACPALTALPTELPLGSIFPALLNRAPPGTKVHVVPLGYLEADEGWLVRSGNGSTMSGTKAGAAPARKRRQLMTYVVLIDHPTAGLILWETGCGNKDQFPAMWGPVADIFAPTDPVEEYELGAAFAKLGYKISDVKAIVMGHLHLDHAGGLTNWIGTNVPIWCHKLELESAFYSVATGADDAVYLGHYLDLSLNWKTFDERTTDLFPGITIHHVPGHTAGLCAMQVSLSSGQTYVFLSDHAHVLDNYHGQPQGWLARDHQAWFSSNLRMQRLEQATKATMIPGHDADVLAPLIGKVLE